MANPNLQKSYAQVEIEEKLISGQIDVASGQVLPDGTMTLDSETKDTEFVSGFWTGPERDAYLQAQVDQFAGVMNLLVTGAVAVAGHIENGIPVNDIVISSKK